MSAEEATFENMQSENATLSPKKKLSPEAEGISRVLVSCISQVKIAASLPAILQFHSNSSDLDQDLSRILQAHQMLVKRLEKLEGQQLKQTKEEKKKMVQLKNDVKDSVRDILRYFRIHPVVLSSLRAELNVEVEESESILIGVLEKLHSHIVENLLSGPDENPRKVLQRQQFSPSVKCLGCMMPPEEAEEDWKQLEDLEEEILKKHSDIKHFQRYLDTHNEQEEEISVLPEKQEEPKSISSSSKLTSLNQEVDQLNAQLNNLMLENQKAQRILREKNETLEMEIENLLQTFDKDIEKLQTELEVVEKRYGNEQEEMRKLQGPFSLLEVQSNQIQEKWRLAEEKREEEIRVLELKSKAAVVIQAWWRGCSVRKALKNKGKSKKGKKGKKGNSKKNK